MKKRADKRHICDASIIFNHFNKENAFNAKVLNYSEYGMYFESDSFFKEGTNIFFKIKSCLFSVSDPEFYEGPRTESLAEVRWCKEISSEDPSRFGIGVKYYCTEVLKLWSDRKPAYSSIPPES